MLIDGFTVVAQLINFLVLVWLLKRYLYRPVLDAIEAREQHIATQLRSAEESQAAANAEQQEYQKKNELLTEQKEALLHEATQQAQEERLRLLTEARQETAALRKSYVQRQTDEYQAWRRALALKAQDEVLEITRRLLRDLADYSLEDKIVSVVGQRLPDLKADEKLLLSESIRNGSAPVTIRSRFSLSPLSREGLVAALNKITGVTIVPRFETSDDLICGIEIDFDGRRVAWNVADYLDEFQRVLDEMKLVNPTTVSA